MAGDNRSARVAFLGIGNPIDRNPSVATRATNTQSNGYCQMAHGIQGFVQRRKIEVETEKNLFPETGIKTG
jgi:hypothetical protein